MKGTGQRHASSEIRLHYDGVLVSQISPVVNSNQRVAARQHPGQGKRTVLVGLITADQPKALAAGKSGGMPRSYWDWQEMLAPNAAGFFPYTPSTNLLYGLREALAMLEEEGLDHVFGRHSRHAAATRAAVRAWGLDILCQDPRDYSPVLTAVVMPDGHDADHFRQVVLDCFDMSLGTGLAKLKGRVFRIGHLGDFNDLMLMGTLAGVEMGLHEAGVPHQQGGVAAAMDVLAGRKAVQEEAKAA